MRFKSFVRPHTRPCLQDIKCGCKELFNACLTEREQPASHAHSLIPLFKSEVSYVLLFKIPKYLSLILVKKSSQDAPNCFNEYHYLKIQNLLHFSVEKLATLRSWSLFPTSSASKSHIGSCSLCSVSCVSFMGLQPKL